MDWLRELSGGEKALIGMVHVGSLPGTPASAMPMPRLIDQAVRDATVLKDAGFDAIIVENMHDTPYVHGSAIGPEIVAAMSVVAREVRRAANLPMGVQILSGGNRHALGVAHATGGEFIRCENFVYAHIADEGLLAEAEAGALLRERRRIGAEAVAIACDIRKKHASHALTADLTIGDMAHAAAFFGADALIVTGAWTGREANPADITEAKAASGLPVLVGSGVTPNNVGAMLAEAEGVIVGSSIKAEGSWRNPVDPERAEALVKAARKG
ncbi:MAG: BtpA family membrane complex biogenesis protein [Phycisphaerales bacterium]|nr:MAG: BtpA family membrane complex biogenesis protein [Phycisphaerales bacterium]